MSEIPAQVWAEITEQREQARGVLTELGRAVAGAELTPLEFDVPSAIATIGFRVRDTGTHYVDVIEQVYNWRVVAGLHELDGTCYEEAYCYLGKGPDSFIKAVLGAAVWDGPGHGAPPGWDKNPFTGEWADGRHLARSS